MLQGFAEIKKLKTLLSKVFSFVAGSGEELNRLWIDFIMFCSSI
jgi:hypothetical protein